MPIESKRIALSVVRPFADYSRGDVITDEKIIKKIRTSDDVHNVTAFEVVTTEPEAIASTKTEK